MFLSFYDIALVISAFIFAVAGTGFAYAVLREKAVDVPNERSNHSAPTPRAGGLGIVFAATSFLLVVDADGLVIWGFLGLAMLSFWDDLRPLPARYRLLAHLAVAFAVLFFTFEGSVSGGLLPRLAEVALLALAWVWFINLFNFMDGSDGLAASEALCLCLGFVALGVLVAIPVHLFSYALVIAGAVAGFLMWNWHPARIFMGDVGSIPLGYIIGFMLISLAGAGYWASALILPAVFLADASLTLLRRLLKGERIFEAHSTHAYQKAIRGGMSHDAVARTVVGVNLLLIMMAVMCCITPLALWKAGYVAFAYLLVFALLIYFSSYRRRQHGLESGVTEAKVVGETPAPQPNALPPAGTEPTA